MPDLTILHVEDEGSDRVLVAAAFARTSPQVLLRAVIDGGEAIAYLGGEGPYADRRLHPLPQLVLLDLKLPRVSGLDVLKWIRSRPDLQSLPVIMLTSSREPGDLSRARELGATSCLVKSADLGETREMIRGIAALTKQTV